MNKDARPTDPGGIAAVLTRMEGRRDPILYAEGETPPAADIDLGALAQQTVGDPDLDPNEGPPYRSSYHRKRHELRRELTGQSELVFLHGLLIAHLRKRTFPDHLPALFQRVWAEQSAHLLEHLDPRWMVSAITTFGDHGATSTQRSVGLALSTLFGTMKLYETERLYSGFEPARPFPLDQKARGPLPLEMNAYSLVSGGLDVNTIGRLWIEAEDDAVMRPLAHHLLEALLHDERSLFRRLGTMRKRLERKRAAPSKARGVAPVPLDSRASDPATLRWGIVTTLRGPLRDIARFAAHHIDLGAHALHIYLDEPNHEAMALLSRHPAIRVTLCDDAYWHSTGKTRPEAHQMRQAYNATRTLRAAAGDLDWLAHIDMDEFLLPARPVPELLAAIPPQSALARIAPVEALAPDNDLPSHFKLTHVHAGQNKGVLQDIYPTFGLHLYGGFLSHSSGKVFVRTGIPDTRLGIHTMKYRGEDATNRHRLGPELRLAHLHAPSWEHFRRHLDFRREKGSYRPRSDRAELDQANVISFLWDEEGEDGLRMLFDEVCADTPDLRARLDAHDMLVTWPLDLDATVARIFGDVP